MHKLIVDISMTEFFLLHNAYLDSCYACNLCEQRSHNYNTSEVHVWFRFQNILTQHDLQELNIV